MRVNPSTGTLWESFESKATYIIASQATVQTTTSDGRAYSANARFDSHRTAYQTD
jgi:hypothetical protein